MDFGPFTQSVGLLGRRLSPSQGRYLNTAQHKENKRTQTSMPQVGFEPPIPVFMQAKTVHTVTDFLSEFLGSASVNTAIIQQYSTLRYSLRPQLTSHGNSNEGSRDLRGPQ
jgi:hypothetical protein